MLGVLKLPIFLRRKNPDVIHTSNVTRRLNPEDINYSIIWCATHEDQYLELHHCENLKSHIWIKVAQDDVNLCDFVASLGFDPVVVTSGVGLSDGH
jgi:hypothetical protein